MAEQNTILPPAPALRNERSPEFVEAYANNVAFEISAWDLKVIFGQIDQSTGTVQQHTAVTVPWSLAKLALYNLRTQISVYELFYGLIRISDDILPLEPPPPPKELANHPKFSQMYEIAKRLREEFIAQVKEEQKNP